MRHVSYTKDSLIPAQWHTCEITGFPKVDPLSLSNDLGNATNCPVTICGDEAVIEGTRNIKGRALQTILDGLVEGGAQVRFYLEGKGE